MKLSPFQTVHLSLIFQTELTSNAKLICLAFLAYLEILYSTFTLLIHLRINFPSRCTNLP